MSDFGNKISELNSLTSGNMAGELPLSLTLSSGTLATNKITLSQVRDLFDFDHAFETVEEGIAATVENQLFYVYVDSNKLSVNEYIRTNIGANAVIGNSGTKKVIYIPELLKHVKVQVDSFAALREFKPWWEGQVVYLKGYYSDGVTGGGDFVGHLGTKVDDGGTVASGSGFYWERQGKKILEVESFGAVGDGQTDDSVSLQRALNIKNIVLIFSNNYLISSTLIPAENVRIKGAGTIIHITDNTFNWSVSNRASPYPAFLISNKNILFEDVTIMSTFEAIQSMSGGDNLIIKNVTAGGTSDKRTLSSVFVFFNTKNTQVLSCNLGYAGKLATWNGTDIAAGGCDGIDFGGCIGIKIFDTICHDVGRNGINWYGASEVKIKDCKQSYCGQNGIQPGPHPSYSKAEIVNNLAEYCCADAIDCRYTGSGTVVVNLKCIGCSSNWIGMLYGDVNYISNDGTGIVTLARVSNVTVSDCISENSSGVILWFEGVSNGTFTNITGISTYTRYGVGFFTDCNTISMSNVNIKVKGSALWFGGSTTMTDLMIGGQCHFESYDSYSLLIPNITLVRFKLSECTFIGYNVANIIFHTTRCEFVTKSTNTSAVYLGVANTKHEQLKCSGSTSAPLVNVGVGSGVMINQSEFINSGTGAALTVVGSYLFILTSCIVYNTGSGKGNAIEITGGQNNSSFSFCDFYSASGYWVNSTAASHTRLNTNGNRENGGLGAFWTSIANVFDIKGVQRT